MRPPGPRGQNQPLAPVPRVPVPRPIRPKRPAARRTPTPIQNQPLRPPFREFIQARLAQELSAQRIYQDLVTERSYDGSYYSVRRFVQKLEARLPLPMRRLECPAGFEAQVDYGSGAPVRGADGKRRRTNVFRIVLSHSRKGYSEASFRQTTDDFIRALENAFQHFGGVPHTIVIDNLKAAVKHPDWYDPELTPKVRAFCEHYGTAILPTRPYTPRHKGKVERGVDYARVVAAAAARKTQTHSALSVPATVRFSAASILPPDVIASSLDARGLQKEFDLNAMLYEPKLTEMFGEDIVFELRGLLVEQASSNYRNQLAHGMLEYGAFFSETAAYIWWLILRLCVFGTLPQPQTGQSEKPPREA